MVRDIHTNLKDSEVRSRNPTARAKDRLGPPPPPTRDQEKAAERQKNAEQKAAEDKAKAERKAAKDANPPPAGPAPEGKKFGHPLTKAHEKAQAKAKKEAEKAAKAKAKEEAKAAK